MAPAPPRGSSASEPQLPPWRCSEASLIHDKGHLGLLEVLPDVIFFFLTAALGKAVIPVLQMGRGREGASPLSSSQ